MSRKPKKARREAIRKRKRRQSLLWISFGGSFLMVIVGALLLLRGTPRIVIDTGNVKAIALGEQVYVSQCASCHGANLEGEADWQQSTSGNLLKAPPHDETGHTWHHDDAYLIQALELGGGRLPSNVGVSTMPAYKDVLSKEEIGAVLAFIKSGWSPTVQAQQASR